MRLKMRGKSLKGKNRIKEHGTNWEVLKGPMPVQCFNGDEAFLVKADDGHVRWVRRKDDHDFVIEEVKK